MVRIGRLTIATLAASLAIAGGSASEGPDEVASMSAERILADAFANRFEVDLVADVQLVMRNQQGQTSERIFRAASKRIDGRVHSLGRLVWPEYLRGMTILTIESEDRSYESFIYLPSMDKVRRITTAQRADSFFGSDVTYEDLERRRTDEYKVRAVDSVAISGEQAYSIEANPLRKSRYDRVDFVIAQSDRAILETRYYKRGGETPFRVIEAPRSGMIEEGGHVLPTRLSVVNLDRGTSTEVIFDGLRVNTKIDDALFSVSALSRARLLTR